MPMGAPGEAEKILRMAAAMFGGMAAGAVGGGPAGAFTGLTGSLAAESPLNARNILMAGGGIAGPGIPEETEFPERRRKFVYDVDYIAGAPQYNAAYKGYPNSRAMRMQTMEEHRRALNKYIRPGMGPLELRASIEKGKEEDPVPPPYPMSTSTPTVRSQCVSATRASGTPTREARTPTRPQWRRMT